MVCDISKHVVATEGDVLIVPFLNNYYTVADASVLVTLAAADGTTIDDGANGVWPRSTMRQGWAVNFALQTTGANLYMHIYVTVFGSDKYLHKMTYVVTNGNAAADAAWLDTTADVAVAT